MVDAAADSERVGSLGEPALSEVGGASPQRTTATMDNESFIDETLAENIFSSDLEDTLLDIDETTLYLFDEELNFEERPPTPGANITVETEQNQIMEINEVIVCPCCPSLPHNQKTVNVKENFIYSDNRPTLPISFVPVDNETYVCTYQQSTSRISFLHIDIETYVCTCQQNIFFISFLLVDIETAICTCQHKTISSSCSHQLTSRQPVLPANKRLAPFLFYLSVLEYIILHTNPSVHPSLSITKLREFNI